MNYFLSYFFIDWSTKMYRLQYQFYLFIFAFYLCNLFTYSFNSFFFSIYFYLFIYIYLNSFICLFIHLFIYLFIRSTHLFLLQKKKKKNLFIYLFIYLFMHSCEYFCLCCCWSISKSVNEWVNFHTYVFAYIYKFPNYYAFFYRWSWKWKNHTVHQNLRALPWLHPPVSRQVSKKESGQIPGGWRLEECCRFDEERRPHQRCKKNSLWKDIVLYNVSRGWLRNNEIMSDCPVEYN